MALSSLDAKPGAYDYGTAKSRLNTALGWNLSDADTQEALQKFGGNPNSGTNDWSDASLQPVYDYFNTRGQRPTSTTTADPAPSGANGGGGTGTAGTGGASGGAGNPAWGPSPTGVAGAPNAPTAAPQDPRLTALFDELSKRAGQSLIVDPNDPTIKATTDAAAVAGQRSLLKNEQAFAERGGPYATGAIADNARMGAEALGENMQGLTATLMTNEVQARRAEIASALSGQFGILSQADQDRLKQEDQALLLRQQDIGVQQNQKTNALAERTQANAEAQQRWMQSFQEKGFSADEAARLWQEMFNQRQQDINQTNTVWDQNWRLSGGGA